MSSTPNPLFQYFPATDEGRICSTCQAPFGPKTGNSTMRRHLQRTHPQQMQQYINQGGSVPGSTPAKIKPPGAGVKHSRKSAPPIVQSSVEGESLNSNTNVVVPSAISSSPLAPTLPPLPLLPILVTPAFGPPITTTDSSTASSLATSTSSSNITTTTSSSSSPASAFNPPGTSIGVPFTDCTLEQLRLSQQTFSNEREWLRYHTPRNLVLALTGEVGELAECFQWREDSECAPGLPAWSVSEREAVSEELSDVLLYLVRLSDRCGIDLSAAVQRKLSINASKYPAKRVRGRSDKYTKYVKEEGKEEDGGGGSGGVNSGEAVEEKKSRKKRKVQSHTARNAASHAATTATTTTVTAEQDSSSNNQRDDTQPAQMDDRKETEETKNVHAG